MTHPRDTGGDRVDSETSTYNIEDFIVTDEQLEKRSAAKWKRNRNGLKIMHPILADWVRLLSGNALKLFLILGLFWRMRRDDRCPLVLDRRVKSFVGISDKEAMARALRELEGYGLIEVERKPGRLHRILYVDVETNIEAPQSRNGN